MGYCLLWSGIKMSVGSLCWHYTDVGSSREACSSAWIHLGWPMCINNFMYRSTRKGNFISGLLFDKLCVFVCTYNLQLKVVSQARCAVHTEQNGMLLLGAEPEGKSICPGAGPLIRWPRVNHQASITAKDVSGPSWSAQIQNVIASVSICHKQC